jgi:cytoskeletal protein CcmA (bactofilin family)
MFNKPDDPLGGTTAQPAAAPVRAGTDARGEPSIISAGLKVIGNMESEGDIVITGTVEGDIKSRGLTVSEGAKVEGSIEVDTVHILGTVNGKVSARAVHIATSGEMTGDVQYETLAVEEGALLEGQCRRAKPGQAGAGAKVPKLKPVESGGKKPEGETATGARSGGPKVG